LPYLVHRHYKDSWAPPVNVLAQRVQPAGAGDQYARSLNTEERLIGEASARAGNGNSDNNDGEDEPTSTKPPVNTSTGSDGVINVGDKPTDAPTPEPTSAPSDDKDTEDCDDSAPECEEYDVPAAGDSCNKHVVLHVLALSKLRHLIPIFIEVSLASAF